MWLNLFIFKVLLSSIITWIKNNIFTLYIFFITKPKTGGLNFAAELAAKIGVPHTQPNDNEEEQSGFTDEEETERIAKPVEKVRSESRASTSSKNKKDKHHKKGRSITKDSHGGHRKRHDSKTSKSSVPVEEGNWFEFMQFDPFLIWFWYCILNFYSNTIWIFYL